MADDLCYEIPGCGGCEGRWRKFSLLTTRRATGAISRRVWPGYGHAVETSASEADGITVGVAFGPDLLIVDWKLENGDSGIRVAASLRQRNPELQTILITGFSAESVLREIDDPPVFRCIEKPFDIEELVAAVGETLTRA